MSRVLVPDRKFRLARWWRFRLLENETVPDRGINFVSCSLHTFCSRQSFQIRGWISKKKPNTAVSCALTNKKLSNQFIPR